MSNPLIKSFCHQLNSPSFMDGGTHTINFYPPPSLSVIEWGIKIIQHIIAISIANLQSAFSHANYSSRSPEGKWRISSLFSSLLNQQNYNSAHCWIVLILPFFLSKNTILSSLLTTRFPSLPFRLTRISFTFTIPADSFHPPLPFNHHKITHSRDKLLTVALKLWFNQNF